jgi:hypothetical protein
MCIFKAIHISVFIHIKQFWKYLLEITDGRLVALIVSDMLIKHLTNFDFYKVVN